jgi:hypothetical protein
MNLSLLIVVLSAKDPLVRNSVDFIQVILYSLGKGDRISLFLVIAIVHILLFRILIYFCLHFCIGF